MSFDEIFDLTAGPWSVSVWSAFYFIHNIIPMIVPSHAVNYNNKTQRIGNGRAAPVALGRSRPVCVICCCCWSAASVCLSVFLLRHVVCVDLTSLVSSTCPPCQSFTFFHVCLSACCVLTTCRLGAFRSTIRLKFCLLK